MIDKTFADLDNGYKQNFVFGRLVGWEPICMVAIDYACLHDFDVIFTSEKAAKELMSLRMPAAWYNRAGEVIQTSIGGMPQWRP